MKEALSLLRSGWDLPLILLADKYVQIKKGKRDVRAIERMLWDWAKKNWTTAEEVVKNMEPLMFEEKIVCLLKLDRNLSTAEKRYIHQWFFLQTEDQMIIAAYERTVLNTGGMNWAYMNKILQVWHEKGFQTMEDLQNGLVKSGYQIFGKDAEIQQLKEEKRSLLQRIIELQDALLREKEKINQLLQENGGKSA